MCAKASNTTHQKTEITKKKRKDIKKSSSDKPPKNLLAISRPKNFGLGGDLPPKRDLTRQVRWPQYVVRQRRRRVLERRMKVPPAVQQFRHALDKATKKELLLFLRKYSPSVVKRLIRAKPTQKYKKHEHLTYGIQEVTRSVETKKAQLVAIAHDVDPLELVLWLPQLCVAQGIPYCIIKSKSELGTLVGHKTCTAVSLTEIRSEDQSFFQKLLTTLNTRFSERFEEIRRSWGGNQQGLRAQIRAKKRKAAIESKKNETSR